MLQDVRRSLRSDGMDIHPIKTRAPYLKGYGFAPDVVIDVGVHDGTRWLYNTFPNAQFVLVDPRDECADAVRDTGLLSDFQFHAVALGAKAGKAVLTVPTTAKGEDGAMASLLPRTGKMAQSVSQTRDLDVAVDTLDNVARTYPGAVGLKIDTEGFELEVLKGGVDTLKRCEFVILELSLSSRFDGAANPSACVACLAQAGLEFRDVLHLAAGLGRRAKPRYMDALFTRWAA